MGLLSETSQGVLLNSILYKEGDDKGDTSSSHEIPPKADHCSSSNASGTNSKSETNRTGTIDDEVNMIKEELAHVETKNVFRLRIIVIIILVVVAIAMSVTVYYITRKAETEAFEIEFEGVGEAIITSLNGTFNDMRVVRYCLMELGSTYLTGLTFSSTFRYLRSHGCGRWFCRLNISRCSAMAICYSGYFPNASKK